MSPPSYLFFVRWTGSEVVTWNGSAATHAFLGPIDTESDAVYWAGHQGYGIEDSAMAWFDDNPHLGAELTP
jgi:hypothetical protein